MTKGSDLLVAALENEGVDRIFALPGEENLDVLESLRHSVLDPTTHYSYSADNSQSKRASRRISRRRPNRTKGKGLSPWIFPLASLLACAFETRRNRAVSSSVRIAGSSVVAIGNGCHNLLDGIIARALFRGLLGMVRRPGGCVLPASVRDYSSQ